MKKDLVHVISETSFSRRDLALVALAASVVPGAASPARAQSIDASVEASAEPLPVGFQTARLASIDLTHEIENPNSRMVRLSRTTIAPGGSLGQHSHKDRPELIYVLEGALTESRSGRAVEHRPGDVLVMTKDITHALANRTTAPVTYPSVSIRALQDSPYLGSNQGGR